MFASYCLSIAGVSPLPQCANCNRWKNKLGDQYIDDEDDYIPGPGDLIFFHKDRVSDDPNFPNHVGIVVDYDPETDIVYTVEGNSGQSVRARQYNRDFERIVGYVSMRKVMIRWDAAYNARLSEALAADLAQIKGDAAVRRAARKKATA